MSVVGYKSSIPQTLLEAQHHLFWDERDHPPAPDSARFILKVMNKGSWLMIEALESTFPSKDYLVEVLKHANAGSLSPKSWNFWCLRLGCELPYPTRFPQN